MKARLAENLKFFNHESLSKLPLGGIALRFVHLLNLKIILQEPAIYNTMKFEIIADLLINHQVTVHK